MITILTPTYNRKANLPALYNSLKEQSCKQFEWIVVDDGSTDGTEALIQSMISDADFSIRYIYKQNGGRHTAINKGLAEARYDLLFPVDSDDKLTPDAIESILACHKKYKDYSEIGMYAFARCNDAGKNFISLSAPEIKANYISFRIKENRPGDMAEVFKTSAIKSNPFPVIPNERFLSEDVCWIEFAKKYDAVFLNKAIYICKYHADGLTANDKPVKFKSPIGSVLRGKQLMYPKCGLKANIKGAIIYNCYRIEIKGPLPEIVRLSSLRDKMLIVLTKPLGKYYHFKWKPKV